MHLKSLCGKLPNQPMADEADPEYKTIQFVFSGVIVLTVGVFGFVGNIFTCVFLKMMSKGMTPFNKLLVTLAIFDMMFICLGGSFITKEALRWVHNYGWRRFTFCNFVHWIYSRSHISSQEFYIKEISPKKKRTRRNFPHRNVAGGIFPTAPNRKFPRGNFPCSLSLSLIDDSVDQSERQMEICTVMWNLVSWVWISPRAISFFNFFSSFF